MYQFVLRFARKLNLKPGKEGIMKISNNQEAIDTANDILTKFKQHRVPNEAIQSENDVKVIYNQIIGMENQTFTKNLKTALTPQKTGDVVDLTGKKIDTSRPIVGGKNVPETEEQILQRLNRQNKETIQRIKDKKDVPNPADYDPDPDKLAHGGRTGFKFGTKPDPLGIIGLQNFDDEEGDEFSDIEGQTAFNPFSIGTGLYGMIKTGLSKKQIAKALIKNKLRKEVTKKVGPVITGVLTGRQAQAAPPSNINIQKKNIGMPENITMGGGQNNQGPGGGGRDRGRSRGRGETGQIAGGHHFAHGGRTGYGIGTLVKEKIPPEYRLYAKSILPGGESGKVGSDYFSESFKRELRAQALDKYKRTGKLTGQVGETDQGRSYRKGEATLNKLLNFPSTYASLGTYTYEIDPKTMDVKITDKYDWNPAYGTREIDDIMKYTGYIGDKRGTDVDLGMFKEFAKESWRDKNIDKANLLEMVGNYFGGKASEGKGFDVDIDIPTKEATPATEGSFAHGGRTSSGLNYLLGEDDQNVRVPFKDGTKFDPKRRGFLKLAAGLASIPIIGKYFKWAKPLAKTVDLTSVPIKNISGMPAWFKPLVNKVIKEGTDVSGKASTIERQVVHKAQLPNSKTDVYVTQDLNTGNVSVEIGSGKHGFADGHLGQPVRLEYKAGEWIETPIVKEGKLVKGHGKGAKTKEEFWVEEAEFTGGHPENVKFEDVSYEKFGEHGSDFTEVEKFATGVVKKKTGKASIKAERSHWTPEGDYASGGRVPLAGGSSPMHGAYSVDEILEFKKQLMNNGYSPGEANDYVRYLLRKNKMLEFPSVGFESGGRVPLAGGKLAKYATPEGLAKLIEKLFPGTTKVGQTSRPMAPKTELKRAIAGFEKRQKAAKLKADKDRLATADELEEYGEILDPTGEAYIVEEGMTVGQLDDMVKEHNAYLQDMMARYKRGDLEKYVKPEVLQEQKAFYQKKIDNVLETAYDDIAGGSGFSGDYKYDADILADSIAEQLGKVYDDLPVMDQRQLYESALKRVQQDLKMKMDIKKLSKPTKTLEGIKKTGKINISDDAVADEFTRFMKETDPKGFKELEQKIQIESFDPKGRKKNASGGRVSLSAGGLAGMLGE